MRSIFYAPWRRLLAVAIALLLTALINQASLSKAAAQSNEYQWKVYFSNRGAPTIALCKGFKYEINVEVSLIYRQPAVEAGEEDYVVRRAINTTVTASGADRGTLIPSYPHYTYAAAGRPARFSYEATDPGNETIEFYAVPNPNQLLDPLAEYLLAFKVRDCNHKVDMIYDGTMPVPYGTYYFTGIMEDVTLEADEDGQLHGEGAMVFYENAVPSPCGLFFTTVTMPATITGEIGEDGQLGLEFSFEEGEGEASMSCRYSPTVTGDMPDRAFLVNSPVSLSSEGGVVTYPSPPPISGTVFVIVTVEDEEQATSDAGSQALAALSAWFAGWPGVLE